MTESENIQLVREWVESVWNSGDVARLADFFPARFDNEGQSATIDVLKEWTLRNHATFPDIRYEIDDIFAVDDRVALRWTATGTHGGTLWGIIPPTGKRATWGGIHMLRLADGRIVAVRATSSLHEMLQQIGVTLQLPSANEE